MTDENIKSSENTIENEQMIANPETTIIPEEPIVVSTPDAKTKQNPLLLVINLAMIVGILVLYVLYFTGKTNGTSAKMAGALEKSSGNISVAFVNNDSIMTNYELVKKMRADLESKSKRLLGEVASKQKTFEKDAAYFQEQVAKKAINEQSAQEIYGQLQQNQQQIYSLNDKYTAELQQSEMDMNVALIDSIMNFLKRYNEKYKFDYILGFNKGGNILYANDTLDVTNDVIKELNAEYLLKHGK